MAASCERFGEGEQFERREVEVQGLEFEAGEAVSWIDDASEPFTTPDTILKR